MRYLTPVLVLLLSASLGASEIFKKILSDPDVQVAMVVNLRNVEMRQKLNAELSKHPGSQAKINRFSAAITHVAVVVMEQDGVNVSFLVAIGRFDSKLRQMLQAEGLPAELMDSQGVCLGITVNGQNLTPEQLQALAQSMSTKKKK